MLKQEQRKLQTDDLRKINENKRRLFDQRKMELIQKEKLAFDAIMKRKEQSNQLVSITYKNKVSSNIARELMNKTMEDWQIKDFSPRMNKDKKCVMA
jgi:predicted RNA binding protein with dsRBD fold (UPF0201 family)